MIEALSMVPGVIWPAIPNQRASQLLAVQFQLEQSQWFSAEELLRRQMGQIGLLFRHAYETVPYYRRRFDEVGLSPENMLGPDEWRMLPRLTRGDIQAARSDLHCRVGVPEHGPVVDAVTSGSSGQPVITLNTTVTRLFYNALLLRQHLWHRRDFSLKLATIRAADSSQDSAQESTYDNWGRGTLDIVRTGPSVVIDVHAGVARHVDFLLKHEPDYLHTYPSIVLALADHFARSGQRLTRLREIRTFGEVLEPRVREASWRVWGVPVVDAYSTQEFGYVALQCPENEHYHVQSECVLVEVLDDAGRACPPGEVGRLVITSLHNFAMPLIRYDIGDYAEVGEPCTCGRGLPVLKRIVGRQRNTFVLPDGRRVWPSLETPGAVQATEVPPVQQFQLVQRTLHMAELLVVSPRLLRSDEEDYLRQMVHRALDYPMDVKITHVAEIPRGPTGKYEDVRSELN